MYLNMIFSCIDLLWELCLWFPRIEILKILSQLKLLYIWCIHLSWQYAMGGVADIAPKILLLAFLSNQEVLGCHKNIYRELRPSLTSFEILGNICCFWGNKSNICWPKGGWKPQWGVLWKTVEKVIFNFSIWKIVLRCCIGPQTLLDVD